MDGRMSAMQLVWDHARGPVIVPALRVLVGACLVMSVMLFLERVYMGIVIAVMRVSGHKPEKRYSWEAIGDDVESGSSAYPMVLVQIPMYNEKEVRILMNCRLATVKIDRVGRRAGPGICN